MLWDQLLIEGVTGRAEALFPWLCLDIYGETKLSYAQSGVEY